MGKKLTQEEFIRRAKEVHGDKYDYSEVEYINSQTKVCVICPIHGRFFITPNAHLSGTGCAECSGLKKWTTEKFIEKARAVHGDKYDYSKTVYVNKRTNVIITCPIHGDFSQNPHNHISQKQGCPECGKKFSKEWRKKGYKHFIEESRKRFGNVYEFPNIENEYENSHSKIHVKCKKCGQIFEKIACDHLTSPHGGCLNCYSNKSKAEEELGDFITTLMGKENVRIKDRSVLPYLEIDIYIPSLKVGFEYNGIYWHSDACIKDKNYHLMKTECCEKRGIKLYQIFEDEYVNKKEIVLAKIKHILKQGSEEKVYARKCSIRNINRKEAKQFLEVNHIQGFVNSTVYIGAFQDNTIVGVMTFIKRKDEWELNRFATDIHKQCCGVGGKLFSFFQKQYNPLIVKSFADRRWTPLIDDNLYTKIGFRLNMILYPDYKYVLTKRSHIERIHKFNLRKKNLKKVFDADITKTEKEITQELKIPRIYDCGLIKYVWQKNLA